MKKFNECPSSPNCVSTYADPNDKEHFIEPYMLEYSPEESYRILLGYLKKRSDVKIIAIEDNDYIQSVFISKIMRFKDDVEFRISNTPEGNTVVNFRSASRIGYGDMGVNRKRMEEIRDYLSVVTNI